MTTFRDGPAAGKTLMLRRAARLLRVTMDLGGKFDALDHPTDRPEPGETLFAYEIVEKPGAIHINKGRNPGGGFYPMATYYLCDPQPDQETMQSNREWCIWCAEQANVNARPELQ